MKPTFFATLLSFRGWLEKHHAGAGELLVGFEKRGTGKPSITWSEAVDQALCFGWIDGVRHRLDDERYSIRFTPRKAGSTWSAVNIARVAELESQGLMRAAGRRAFERRTEAKSRTYSYERAQSASLDPSLQKKLVANKPAWAFFQAQAPSYQRKVIHWVVGAKKEEVRLMRLTRLIEAFAKGRRP